MATTTRSLTVSTTPLGAFFAAIGTTIAATGTGITLPVLMTGPANTGEDDGGEADSSLLPLGWTVRPEVRQFGKMESAACSVFLFGSPPVGGDSHGADHRGSPGSRRLSGGVTAGRRV